jgi:hypothetical protein
MRTLLKLILFKNFSKKWRTILITSYCLFFITFATGLILIRLNNNNSFAKDLFIASIFLCLLYSILKLFAEREKRKITRAKIKLKEIA